MNVDAVGNQSGAVPHHLTSRTQIRDIGDAQPAQLVTAVVVEPAQFAGPEQPPGSQTPVVVRDVAKVPRALQSRTTVAIR